MEPNVLPLVWCGRLEREVPAHVPSSSSDHGSKSRANYFILSPKLKMRQMSIEGTQIPQFADFGEFNPFRYEIYRFSRSGCASLRGETPRQPNKQTNLEGNVSGSSPSPWKGRNFPILLPNSSRSPLRDLWVTGVVKTIVPQGHRILPDHVTVRNWPAADKE
ncbi:hypothetical protein AVEN_122136-1 [Araneus ventricosus]|uniref:Uncharacterized protein n=1 Tax=Araneus ventricosus TaxID=182803 RepID=A0A4Y2I9I3_ARAVE|nr:hypothetical protein AVEN_122136-1 [Araneus ventricosus]